MENEQIPIFKVADFVAVTNQMLEYTYPSVMVEGEVDSFTVNQKKFVFFTLKDSEASVNCFMMLFALSTPIENGMKVIVKARPKLTQWGKFSLTIDSIRPSGEGSIKRSFDLLKAKLEKEGLFASDRKRSLPYWPKRVAIVSSVESAGYADFMKIASEKVGGVAFSVYHTQVQGGEAPAQIIKAITSANEAVEPADVLVLIRGGGSADDLAAFSDEKVVRAIAGSRIPTLVGVGHEVDITLADMAADVRAATPSNAADMLLPDCREVIDDVQKISYRLASKMRSFIDGRMQYVDERSQLVQRLLLEQLEDRRRRVDSATQLLASYNPLRVLERGYAIMRGSPVPGERITVETAQEIVTAKVESYEAK